MQSRLLRQLRRRSVTIAQAVAMGTAVICIDMQNDFCLPDASLFVKESRACIPKCKQLIARARKLNIPVVWVIREHDCDGVLGTSSSVSDQSPRAHV